MLILFKHIHTHTPIFVEDKLPPLAFKVTEIVSVFILIQTNVTNVVLVVAAAFPARLLNILSFDLTPWQHLAPSFQTR